MKGIRIRDICVICGSYGAVRGFFRGFFFFFVFQSRFSSDSPCM